MILWKKKFQSSEFMEKFEQMTCHFLLKSAISFILYCDFPWPCLHLKVAKSDLIYSSNETLIDVDLFPNYRPGGDSCPNIEFQLWNFCSGNNADDGRRHCTCSMWSVHSQILSIFLFMGESKRITCLTQILCSSKDAPFKCS